MAKGRKRSKAKGTYARYYGNTAKKKIKQMEEDILHCRSPRHIAFLEEMIKSWRAI